jgi:hypothetical protein
MRRDIPAPRGEAIRRARLTGSRQGGTVTAKRKQTGSQAMIRKHAPLLAVLALAACGGNPLQFGGPPAPPPPVGEPGEEAPITGVTVPAIVAQHLRSAEYTPGAPTMKIDLRTLDGTPLAATYQRAAEFDVAGFDAYTVQETRSQRQFLALFKRGTATEAGVVADGGQFVNYFGGGTFARLQPFTLPTPVTPLPTQTNQNPQPTLLATYVGGYVGLLNFGPSVANTTIPASRSFRVEGEVAINADFNAENMSLNGGIFNRVILPDPNATPAEGNLPGPAPLQDVFFEFTQITSSGSFSGIVKFTPTKAIGNYAGVFGGAGASEVAGVTLIKPIDGDQTAREHGAFVLPKCIVGVVGAVNHPSCP